MSRTARVQPQGATYASAHKPSTDVHKQCIGRHESSAGAMQQTSSRCRSQIILTLRALHPTPKCTADSGRHVLTNGALLATDSTSRHQHTPHQAPDIPLVAPALKQLMINTHKLSTACVVSALTVVPAAGHLLEASANKLAWSISGQDTNNSPKQAQCGPLSQHAVSDGKARNTP